MHYASTLLHPLIHTYSWEESFICFTAFALLMLHAVLQEQVILDILKMGNLQRRNYGISCNCGHCECVSHQL